MPRSLPFISPGEKKKGRVYKNLFAKGHTGQPNTLLFHFHFAPPSVSPASCPLLSLSPLTISRPRLSSSRAILIRQTGPVLPSKAATVSSYQPVTSYLSFRLLFREEETELQWNHGPVDSQHKKIIESRKKVWQVLPPTCFHHVQFSECFGSWWSPQICYRAVEYFWVTLGEEVEVWIQKVQISSSDGSPHSVNTSWNASCSCLFYKTAASNIERAHQNPLWIYFSMLHILLENVVCQML